MLYALKAASPRWVLVEPGSENDPAGLDNYIEVLGAASSGPRCGSPSAMRSASIACGLVLGTCFALLLNLDFFWRTFFRSVMIIPMVITPAVIGIFWKLLYEQEDRGLQPPAERDRAARHRLAQPQPGAARRSSSWMCGRRRRSSCWSSWPACTRSTRTWSMPRRVDGASRWQMFRYILLPHLLPYMLIAASFRCIAAMGDFDKIWLLTGGGPGDRTTTITMFTYKTGFSAFDIGRTTAIAWIFVVVVLVVSSPLLRHLFKTAAGGPLMRSAGFSRSQREAGPDCAVVRARLRLSVSLYVDGADRRSASPSTRWRCASSSLRRWRGSARFSANGFQTLSASTALWSRSRRPRSWSPSPRPQPMR